MNRSDASEYPQLEAWNFTYQACTTQYDCQNGTFNPLKKCSQFGDVGFICTCDFLLGRYGPDCMKRSTFGDLVTITYIVPIVYCGYILFRILKLLVFRLRQKKQRNSYANSCLIVAALTTIVNLIQSMIRVIVQFVSVPEVVIGLVAIIRVVFSQLAQLLTVLCVCMVSLAWLNIIETVGLKGIHSKANHLKMIIWVVALLNVLVVSYLLAMENYALAAFPFFLSMVMAYISIPFSAGKLAALLLRSTQESSPRSSQAITISPSVHESSYTKRSNVVFPEETNQKMYKIALTSVVTVMKGLSKRILIEIFGTIVMAIVLAQPPLKSKANLGFIVVLTFSLTKTFLVAGIVNYLQECTKNYSTFTSSRQSQSKVAVKKPNASTTIS